MNDIEYMRNFISNIDSDARRRKCGIGDGEFLLPGFNIPKGRLMLSYFLVFYCNMRNCIFKLDLDFNHFRPYGMGFVVFFIDSLILLLTVASSSIVCWILLIPLFPSSLLSFSVLLLLQLIVLDVRPFLQLIVSGVGPFLLLIVSCVGSFLRLIVSGVGSIITPIVIDGTLLLYYTQTQWNFYCVCSFISHLRFTHSFHVLFMAHFRILLIGTLWRKF